VVLVAVAALLLLPFCWSPSGSLLVGRADQRDLLLLQLPRRWILLVDVVAAAAAAAGR